MRKVELSAVTVIRFRETDILTIILISFQYNRKFNFKNFPEMSLIELSLISME